MTIRYKREEEQYIRRCLELAKNAEGATYPNPIVGAVVVSDGKIIGEGFHRKAGGPHAEVFAINSVKDKSLLKKSTIYVSLEPCSHFGKTPPCADLIIDSGIPNVVVGTIDSNSKVAGKGIMKLKDAGCHVIVGVLDDECRWINRRFITFHEKKRPYIILKWAQSADGFIDIDPLAQNNRGSYWISGLPERVLVHKWRATEQAILVGGRTVRVDNPSLDVRYWSGRNPLRLVLSKTGNISGDASIFSTNGQTILFSEVNKSFNNCVTKLLNKEEETTTQIMNYLYETKIQSVIVEGGAETLGHFITSGLWDEARIFTGKESFQRGVKAPDISGREVYTQKFEKSTLRILCNK